MIKISGVIITFNEEKNIEKCLRSLVGLVDEIIVLDSFSTDNTKEICRRFNVKFYEQKFTSYTIQKNKVVSLASNDYVLSLDADELVSEQLKQSILDIKQSADFEAYNFNRLNIYCGKPIKNGGWYPDKKIRLWDRRKGEWKGDLIHEIVEMRDQAKIKFLNGDLLHYSFNSIEEHISQINKFSDIKALASFQNNKKTNFFKIFVKPKIKFFIQYILKLGFLDGFYGYVISKNSAYSEFLKQIKLRDQHHNAKIQ